jgi:hypothetical protein
LEVERFPRWWMSSGFTEVKAKGDTCLLPSREMLRYFSQDRLCENVSLVVLCKTSGQR